MRHGGVDIDRAPKEAVEMLIEREHAGGGSSGAAAEGEEEVGSAGCVRAILRAIEHRLARQSLAQCR
jgi:hypothetical protein